MDLSATHSLTLGSDRVKGCTKSGQRHSSARLRSLKAGTVSLVNVGEVGPPWCGIEDKTAWGHCGFQCNSLSVRLTQAGLQQGRVCGWLSLSPSHGFRADAKA